MASALFASGDAVLARDNGNFYAARVIKVEKGSGQGRKKRVGALRGQESLEGTKTAGD
eukprot:COSAG01_NODE_27687_length_678_cov_1.291379_1_plen_58_part_00